MDEPANLSELVSEFASITGASPLVADHYLSACNYDLNRAVEFFFEHPPALNQPGPRAQSVPDGDAEAAAMAAYGGVAEAGFRGGVMSAAGGGAADEDEELQRALAASMGAEEPVPRRGGRQDASATAGRGPRPDRDVEVIGDDDEELPDADELLAAMARQQEAAQQADREARGNMEDIMDRMMSRMTSRPSGTVNPPPGYPTGAIGGLPSMFPGLFPGMPHGLIPPGMGPPSHPLFPGPLGGAPRFGRGRDEGAPGEPADGSRGRNGSGGGAAGAGQAQRRRVEIRQGGGGGGAGAEATASGRGEAAWDDELELPEGMSRHDLEEARMMEAALLGVPYEGRLPDYSSRSGVPGAEERGVAPELLEHRELRWDQDRAYEESLAADRAKEQAAARTKAETEARERAQREAEESSARAASEEAARLAALLSAKARRLPSEPPSSATDAVTVMVRLPDGSRHSRRFARTDRLSAVFDFVDVELDSTAKAAAAAAAGGGDSSSTSAASLTTAPSASSSSALKPGTYNLVAQFPRRVFSEAESGGETLEEAGLAGGGGAAFFIEQKSG